MARQTEFVIARRDTAGTSDAFARQAYDRWVNDGGTHLRDRRWTLSTAVATSVHASVAT
jgi:hypothetical protein